jgi:hypothetical protein
MKIHLLAGERTILRLYAEAKGENWRECLANDWRTGADVWTGNRLMRGGGSILRTLRNHKGPKWLMDVEL